MLEKTALDIWYAEHASLLLVLKISLLTIRTLLTGERLNARAVRQCMDFITSGGGAVQHPFVSVVGTDLRRPIEVDPTVTVLDSVRRSARPG